MKKVVVFVLMALVFGMAEAKDRGPKRGEKSKTRAEVVQKGERERPSRRKKPKQGIVGLSLFVSCPVAGPGAPCMTFPFPTTLTVIEHKRNKMRVLGEVTTDDSGNFVIELKPGTYTLVPWVPEPEDASTFPPPPVVPIPFAFPVTVEVKKKEFTEVTIGYENRWPQ